MTSRSKSRDVQEELKNNRRRHRLPGEKPYPVKYATEQLAHDNWNHMFLKSLSQGLTLRQYETPPANILDLGCGSGLWVIEAAKAWPYSQFTGYDCLQIQPDLKVMSSSQPGLGDLTNRIKWIHGNFLDPLPFEDSSFDFVRICGVGLGVPEDEWQSVLQEVSRVLKPGAFIEIIEEDLIFPVGADTIKESEYRSSARKTTPLLDVSSAHSQNSTRSRTSNLSVKSPTSRLVSTLTRFQSDNHAQASSEERSSSPLPTLSLSETLEPRDHTKLKAAWDSMLHQSFLAPGLLSVLQFYFSAEFEEVQSHPPIRIVLPSNSRLTFEDAPHIEGRARSISVSSTVSTSAKPTPLVMSAMMSSSDFIVEGYGLNRVDTQPQGPVITTSWATMHLSKTFSTVQGCKEAIWDKYKDLDGPINDEDLDAIRAEFLAAWDIWSSDMKDRIGLRCQLQGDTAWSASATTDPPAFKSWRNRAGYIDSVDGDDPEPSHTDICRALRGFVGKKPFHEVISS
ncbi:S-adenosyl-L-methionine-dependent methyltransferase [Trametopsis cervina]|nr:S-adenosyl-L-methionine-dependent methyltransferase [Trametopsis cervina]